MGKIVGISIKEELHDKTQKYCKDTGRSVSGLIAFLLNKYFEDEGLNK